jgi:hypothetical protein
MRHAELADAPEWAGRLGLALRDLWTRFLFRWAAFFVGILVALLLALFVNEGTSI